MFLVEPSHASFPSGNSGPSGDPDIPENCAGGLLTIDLDAVIANWRIMQGFYQSSGQAAAVVKANAYGLGARHVVPALVRAGCRIFFVALPHEAFALKPLLPPDVLLYVLSPPTSALETLAFLDIRPVLSTPDHAALWLAHAPDKPYGVHVDTGMHRLGLSQSQFAALEHRLSPALLLSHLSCSAGHCLTSRQLSLFSACHQKMPQVPASLSASGGILIGPEYRFDIGRPGLALYGGNPLPRHPNHFHPVVSLDLKILQIHEIDTPGWVGYGATHVVKPGDRLATVAAGYADGLPRSLSNRGFGSVGGLCVPFVGRVSMDMIGFDVSAVPAELTRPGQTIAVLHPEHTIDDLAAEAGTLPYEILTSLSPRYHRRYCGGSGATL